ncbi:MAG: baseplate J/gp47 family protein, partial [Roseomonas sp.]|nr:baseplate J/gp47 family protein [Roseomonas sp.]
DDVRYTLDADVTIGAGGTASGTVTAVEAGATGNAVAATALTLIAPAAGIQPAATVAAGGLGAGADEEKDPSLRARLLDRMRTMPAGGAAVDYRSWALTVAGVDRVWVYPRYLGAGTVGVAFLGPNAAIPAAPLVAAVQAAIDALRPVTADVTVFAPTAVPVNVSLTLALDTAATRAAVQAALAAFFIAEAEPGATLRLSRLSAAISAAAGESWHSLTAPAADVVLTAGQVATLGTVSFL